VAFRLQALRQSIGALDQFAVERLAPPPSQPWNFDRPAPPAEAAGELPGPAAVFQSVDCAVLAFRPFQKLRRTCVN